MTRPCALIALLAVAAFNAAPAAADHPIAGVIALLEKLEVETKQEAAAEAESFQKFQYWCKRSTRMLTRAIKKEKKLIGEMKDKIEGLSADIMTLGEDIAALEKQLEVLDQQKEKAEAMRQEEHTLYQDDIENLDGSIEATDVAIEVMEEEDHDDMLLQTGAKHVNRKKAIKAGGDPADLLKLDPGASNPFKPKAKTFSAHSGGVIETFKGLEDGWGIDKLSEEEQETNAINAYKLAKQARDSAIATAEASKAEKESIKGDKEGEKAQAESTLSETTNQLEGDSASQESTDADCKTMTAEYDERTKIRNGELEAMAMAKKILAKVTGVRNPDEHEIPTKSLFEATARVSRDYVQDLSVSLVQLDDPRQKAINLLRQAASKAHSKSLRRLATELSSYDGPFDKIKAMIQKMIFQLMGEQKDEDEHKLWCDMETEKSTESQTDKAEKKRIMTAKVQEKDTAIKLLVKQITEQQTKVADITSYKETETKLRDENHAEIELTIKDAQDAQKALEEAIAVLKDFYKESGMIAKEPWEFVQTASRRDVELPEKPSTWDSSYTGTADPKSGSDGILTILDETMQKFSKMEADAKVADETDQKEYEQDMAAKKIEVDEANTDIQMKTGKKTSLEGEMSEEAARLKSTTGELDAVEQYLKDLEQACGTGDSSYDDRKKARADEMDALRQAQTILEEAFRAKAFLQHK
jgi:hypothetical protein